MNEYQFHQIVRRMEQRYGKIKKNEEERYAMLLFPMESNLLKIHRKNPEANSRRLEEAILLSLHEIENMITEERKDTEKYETKENVMLKKALMSSFDPFENEEIKGILESELELNNKDTLKDYYQIPVMCMLRIKDSVELWIKKNGSDGYFDFLESWMGHEIPNDEQMSYSICSSKII